MTLSIRNIIYTFLILFILLICVATIWFLLYNRNNAVHNKNELTNLREELSEIKNKIDSGEIIKQFRKQIMSNTVNLRGPQGRQGNSGPAGGTFLNKGYLRNLEKTSLVADRMYGNGTNSISFLNTPNYSTHQNWTYLTTGELQNKFGGCLEGNPDTNDVYMSTCNKGKNQTWNYDNIGKIRLKNDPNKCLSIKFKDNISTSPKIINTKSSDAVHQKDIYKLELTKCDDNLNPQSELWSFL